MSKAIERGLSDSSLTALWRRAVLRHYSYQCITCLKITMPDRLEDRLEAHHCIHKRYKLLRWDWRNGVPVHHGDCHEEANRFGIFAAPGHEEYLADRAKLTFKQYLADTGLSENEWRQEVKAELLREINA